MPTRLGPKFGPKHGPLHGVGNFGDSPSITRDGPGLVFVPQSSADFTSLGISTPASLWLCQEGSGNLADSIGATTLSAFGTFTYQSAVAGWTRRGVVLDTNNERFATAAGVNPATNSVAWLFYVLYDSSIANAIMFAGSHDGVNGLRITATAGGLLQVVCQGNTTAGAVDHRSAATVRAIMLKYNRTAGTVQAITNLETINGVYGAGVVDSTKGIGANGGSAANMTILWAACWSGAAAEGVGAGTLTTLGW